MDNNVCFPDLNRWEESQKNTGLQHQHFESCPETHWLSMQLGHQRKNLLLIPFMPGNKQAVAFYTSWCFPMVFKASHKAHCSNFNHEAIKTWIIVARFMRQKTGTIGEAEQKHYGPKMGPSVLLNCKPKLQKRYIRNRASYKAKINNTHQMGRYDFQREMV